MLALGRYLVFGYLDPWGTGCSVMADVERTSQHTQGFPTIRAQPVGSPHVEDHSVLGSILGPLVCGNSHILQLGTHQ